MIVEAMDQGMDFVKIKTVNIAEQIQLAGILMAISLICYLKEMKNALFVQMVT